MLIFLAMKLKTFPKRVEKPNRAVDHSSEGGSNKPSRNPLLLPYIPPYRRPTREVFFYLLCSVTFDTLIMVRSKAIHLLGVTFVVLAAVGLSAFVSKQSSSASSITAFPASSFSFLSHSFRSFAIVHSNAEHSSS
jgi:hypothetical protein